MPLSGTPAPNKRKKPTSSKVIAEITQEVLEQTDPESSKLNLGKKISTPKDIMLEELSLLSNKGSKMFKMRQKRVEKFIYENNPDVFISDSVDNFQKFVSGLGGDVQSGRSMMDVGGRLVSVQMVGHSGTGKLQQAPVPPPKPGDRSKSTAGGTGAGKGGGSGSTGAGGETTVESIHIQGKTGDASGGKGAGKTNITIVKTYISPWERAMRGDAELTATMRATMPGPCTQQDLPKYKCFNRSAMPFGGYEKASKLMTFQLPEFDAAPEEPEPPVVYQHDIASRPSFNRTPIGWVGSGDTGHITVQLETVPFDGETDEL
ncbi:myozenin-1a [Polypterus senegalus]|nr:myozenin-1a [Polypterus senegalus]